MTERSPYNRRNREITRTRYLKFKVPGHPLAHADGQVYAHRIILYDRIGPGEHPCHWCDALVVWDGKGRRALKTDHLDDDGHNNDPENLVPSCNRCNCARKLLARTHCFRGHEYTPANTYYRNNKNSPFKTRMCRECCRLRDGKRRPPPSRPPFGRKAVLVDGIQYPSQTAAARAHGRSREWVTSHQDKEKK